MGAAGALSVSSGVKIAAWSGAGTVVGEWPGITLKRCSKLVELCIRVCICSWSAWLAAAGSRGHPLQSSLLRSAHAAWRASAAAPRPGGASRMLLVLSVRAGGKPGNSAGTIDSIMRRPSSMPVRMVPASVHSGE